MLCTFVVHFHCTAYNQYKHVKLWATHFYLWKVRKIHNIRLFSTKTTVIALPSLFIHSTIQFGPPEICTDTRFDIRVSAPIISDTHQPKKMQFSRHKQKLTGFFHREYAVFAKQKKNCIFFLCIYKYIPAYLFGSYVI